MPQWGWGGASASAPGMSGPGLNAVASRPGQVPARASAVDALFIRATSIAGTSGAAASSLNVTVPTSTRVGDLILVVGLVSSGGQTWTTPTGYNLAYTAQNGVNALGMSTYWKIATGADAGSTVAITISGSQAIAGMVVVVAGTDPSWPIDTTDAAPWVVQASATSITSTSANAIHGGDLVLTLLGRLNATTDQPTSTTSNVTEGQVSDSFATNVTTGVHIFLQAGRQDAAGPSASVTNTFGVSNVMLALTLVIARPFDAWIAWPNRVRRQPQYRWHRGRSVRYQEITVAPPQPLYQQTSHSRGAPARAVVLQRTRLATRPELQPLPPVMVRTARRQPPSVVWQRGDNEVSPVGTQVVVATNPDITQRTGTARRITSGLRRLRASAPTPSQDRPLAGLARGRRYGLNWWSRADNEVSPPPAQQVAPTNPDKVFTSSPRRVLAALARGRDRMPVPAQQAATPNPAIALKPSSPRRVMAGLARGRDRMPVPAQQAAPTNPAITQLVLPTKRLAAILRRSRGNPQAPVDQLRPGAQSGTRRRTFGLWRSGKDVAPVPAQIVVAPPSYPPRPSSPRRAYQGFGRGKFRQPVQDQQPLAPNPALTQRFFTQRRILAGLKRGKDVLPVQPQSFNIPTYPPSKPQPRRLTLGGLRRGRDVFPVQPPPAAPTPATPIRPVAPKRIVSGRTRARVASQVPTQAGLPTTKRELRGHLAYRVRLRLSGWFPGTISPPVLGGSITTVERGQTSMGSVDRGASSLRQADPAQTDITPVERPATSVVQTDRGQSGIKGSER